jgi:hypothetical protein
MPPVFFCFMTPRPDNAALLSDAFPGALVFLSSLHSLNLADPSSLYIFRESSASTSGIGGGGTTSSSVASAMSASSVGASAATSATSSSHTSSTSADNRVCQNIGMRSLRATHAWADPDKVKAVRSAPEPWFHFLRNTRVLEQGAAGEDHMQGQPMPDPHGSMWEEASRSQTPMSRRPYTVPGIQPEASLASFTEVDGHVFGHILPSHASLARFQDACRSFLSAGETRLQHSFLRRRSPSTQSRRPRGASARTTIDLTEEGEPQHYQSSPVSVGSSSLPSSPVPLAPAWRDGSARKPSGRAQSPLLIISPPEKHVRAAIAPVPARPSKEREANVATPPLAPHGRSPSPEAPLTPPSRSPPRTLLCGMESVASSGPIPGYMSFGLSSLLEDDYNGATGPGGGDESARAIAAPSLHDKVYSISREWISEICLDVGVLARGMAIPPSSFKGTSSAVVGDSSHVVPQMVQVQALMQGSKSELYKCFATLPGGVPCSCTCPYLSSPCKHIVALLFHFSKFPGDFGPCSTSPESLYSVSLKRGDVFSPHRQATIPAPLRSPTLGKQQSAPSGAPAAVSGLVCEGIGHGVHPGASDLRISKQPSFPAQKMESPSHCSTSKRDPSSPVKVKREPARERPALPAWLSGGMPPSRSGATESLEAAPSSRAPAPGAKSGDSSSLGVSRRPSTSTSARVLPDVFSAPNKRKRGRGRGGADGRVQAPRGGVVPYRMSADELLAVATRILVQHVGRQHSSDATESLSRQGSASSATAPTSAFASLSGAGSAFSRAASVSHSPGSGSVPTTAGGRSYSDPAPGSLPNLFASPSPGETTLSSLGSTLHSRIPVARNHSLSSPESESADRHRRAAALPPAPPLRSGAGTDSEEEDDFLGSLMVLKRPRGV